MPNRFQSNVYQVIYDYIVARDGEYCLIGKIGHRKCEGSLQIDHADSNSRNWNYNNLHLLCQKHNLEMRNRTSAEHLRLVRDYSAKNVCEREKRHGIASSRILKSVVNYSDGGVEMQVTSICERVVTDWVLTSIKKYGQLIKKDTVNSAAAIAGCSPITASRYLDKLICSVGPLEEFKDEFSRVCIRYKKKLSMSHEE